MSAKSMYLLGYNAVSFSLWAYLLCRSISSLPYLYPESRLQALYPDLFPTLAATQSLALLEVLHAALGVVKSSPATTALQVGGKNLVVWTVMAPFEDIVSSQMGIWGFFGCIVAWGCSETIRYGFFAVQIACREAPSWLKWLRYSAFIVLYPPGFLSEAWLVYLSLSRAAGISPLYKSYLFLGLASYLPAGYFLYTYMLSQRRRVLARDERIRL
ncbi:tyrosine phosphatase-like protein [Biscogniauxia sp. FL1348]|nr:tyrosine phosphatase-like protein [Biscogniauxia sp. FL1348]